MENGSGIRNPKMGVAERGGSTGRNEASSRPTQSSVCQFLRKLDMGTALSVSRNFPLYLPIKRRKNH